MMGAGRSGTPGPKGVNLSGDSSIGQRHDFVCAAQDHSRNHPLANPFITLTGLSCP